MQFFKKKYFAFNYLKLLMIQKEQTTHVLPHYEILFKAI